MKRLQGITEELCVVDTKLAEIKNDLETVKLCIQSYQSDGELDDGRETRTTLEYEPVDLDELVIRDAVQGIDDLLSS